MFKTNHARRSCHVAVIALIGAVCVATVTSAVAAPMANHPPQTTRLVPLAADEGIRLGSVSADGDCVAETAAAGALPHADHLTCVQ